MSLIKVVLLSLAISLPLLLPAQDNQPQPDKESRAYHDLRMKITKPPYSLAKVQTLVAGIKAAGDEYDLVLKPKTYEALSLREKFTYHMIHGEAESQNCDVMPPIMEEQKKIFAYLPDLFDDYGWSERQTRFFNINRDSVLALIKESTSRSRHMGLNYKQAIVDMDAVEIIPFIVQLIKTDPKDHDLLTVLMLLMHGGHYAPFLQSASYKKLYGDDADYLAFLNYNTANEQLIISRATAFYNIRK